ncbi:MAG: acyl-CoA thioesterase [Bradymonadaceae bacterium]
MTKDTPFEVEIVVRGYELDSFNHVNNAVFLNYFEHARWMAFKELGLARLSEEGLTTIMRKVTVEYDRPAHVFDELRLRLWIARIGRTSLTFGQDIVRKSDASVSDDTVLARAEVVVVCVGPDGRPHPVPEEWKPGKN